MRTYLQPHQIEDDLWYSLSTWDYRVISKGNRVPANTRPYPNIVIKQGRQIKEIGLPVWESSRAPSWDAYQGHASDGSSVQKHSCGGLYPHVIFAQETIEGLRYGVVGPGKPNGILVGSYEQAVSFAVALKEAK
jgi:hypothetical protein